MQELDRPLDELVSEFFEHLRNSSEISYLTYKQHVSMLGYEPLNLAQKAIDSPRVLEREIISWINTKNYRPNSKINIVSHAKTFLDYLNAQELNWVRIKKNLPPATKGKDRKVLAEEVRLIHVGQSKRQMFLNLLLYTSGIRIGAFYYWVHPSNPKRHDFFRVKDLEEIEVDGVTIGKLIVYRGDLEEYVTFVSPECVRAWYGYRKERELGGEKITPESPLIISEKYPGEYRAMAHTAIQNVYFKQWASVGLNVGIRKFHLVHGFRKAFKTNLEESGMKSLYIKILQNHKAGLDSVYYRPDSELKPSESQLAKEYVKHLNCLLISEEANLKKELQEKEKQYEEKENKWYIDFKKLQEQVANINTRLDDDEEEALKRNR